MFMFKPPCMHLNMCVYVCLCVLVCTFVTISLFSTQNIMQTVDVRFESTAKCPDIVVLFVRNDLVAFEASSPVITPDVFKAL